MGMCAMVMGHETTRVSFESVMATRIQQVYD